MLVKFPQNSMSGGNVWIAAASCQLMRLVSPPSPNFQWSLSIFTMSGELGCSGTCFAMAGIVNETSSQPLFLLRDM